MGNHFHLVVQTPQANWVDGMRWLLSTYSNGFNHRRKKVGHLFSGRYKALHVEGNGTGYLRTVCDYVHLNPVRARLLRTGQRLIEYPWSSFGFEPMAFPSGMRFMPICLARPGSGHMV
jgi:hypothetical protein